MFRIDYVQQGEPITEIHDFNTGLRYVSKRYRRTCDISVLSDSIDSESDGINLRIRNPTEFFDLDLNTVQFNGYVSVLFDLRFSFLDSLFYSILNRREK